MMKRLRQYFVGVKHNLGELLAMLQRIELLAPSPQNNYPDPTTAVILVQSLLRQAAVAAKTVDQRSADEKMVQSRRNQSSHYCGHTYRPFSDTSELMSCSPTWRGI
jgi:hypothetical protein